MPIGVKLVIVIGLFLMAGLLIGWGSGTAARGSRKRAAPPARARQRRGPTFTPEIGRWGGAEDERRRPTAIPDENPPKELPRARRKRGRALPEGD